MAVPSLYAYSCPLMSLPGECWQQGVNSMHETVWLLCSRVGLNCFHSRVFVVSAGSPQTRCWHTTNSQGTQSLISMLCSMQSSGAHLKGSAQSEARSVAFSAALSAGLAVTRCLALEAEPLTSSPLPNQPRIPAREPGEQGVVLLGVIKACM